MDNEVTELEALADQQYMREIVIASQEIKNKDKNQAIKLILQSSRDKACEALKLLTQLDPNDQLSIREAQNLIEVHNLLCLHIHEILNMENEAREVLEMRRQEFLREHVQSPTKENEYDD